MPQIILEHIHKRFEKFVAVEDLNLRIQKTLQKTKMDEKDRELLLKTFDQAAGKVLTKLLFGLKENLNPGTFLECIEGLEKIYEE